MSRFKRIRRLPALVVAFSVAALAVAALAIADNLIADGDGLAQVDNNDMAFGSVSCDQDVSKNALLAITRNGSGTNVFKNGTTVTVNVVSVTGSHASAVSPSLSGGNTITLPANWGALANNTRSDTVTSSVEIHPTSSGPGSATITYSATGLNGSNVSITRADTLAVTWTAGSCDTTAPTSSASAKNADDSDYTFGDWTNQSVTVTLSGEDNDGGSGLKEIRYTTDGSTPTASSGTVYGSPFTISAEGTTTVKWRAIDNVGNLEDVHSEEVKIDTIAPSAGCGSADTSWHAVDVSIGCTASDGGSGLADEADATFNLSTDVPGGTEDANASTGSRTVFDKAGNSNTAGPIAGNMVDKKGPSVDCDAADGVWYATDVSIACTASDGGSGVYPSDDEEFSLTTDVAAGTETDNAETDTKVVSDAVGNTTTAGPVGGNMVDKKGPSITCDTPAPSFSVGQSPADVTGTATDGGSGLQTSATPSAAADTSTVVGNPKSVTLSATDNVENSTTQNCSYSVVYGFTGFFQPVDMNEVFNKAKAGSAIPVKFSLDGAPQPGSNTPGLAGASSAFMPGTATSPNPSVALVACPTSTTLVNVIEELATDSTSGLKYDPAADQWIYVWKTTTVLANSCRQLRVVLADGTMKTANFQFTK